MMLLWVGRTQTLSRYVIFWATYAYDSHFVVGADTLSGTLSQWKSRLYKQSYRLCDCKHSRPLRFFQNRVGVIVWCVVHLQTQYQALESDALVDTLHNLLWVEAPEAGEDLP
jgi:hypothetical protein